MSAPTDNSGGTGEGEVQGSYPKGFLDGKRIEIYWPRERKWFAGLAALYDPEEDLYRIDYDDGEKEVVDIDEEKWRFEDDEKTKKRLQALRAREERERKKARTTITSIRTIAGTTPPPENQKPSRSSTEGNVEPAPKRPESENDDAEDDNSDSAAAPRRGRTGTRKRNPPGRPPLNAKATREQSPTENAAQTRTTRKESDEARQNSEAVARLREDVDFLKKQLLEVRDSIAMDQRKSADEYKGLGARADNMENSVRAQLKAARDYYESASKLGEENERKFREQTKRMIAQLESVSRQAESFETKLKEHGDKTETNQKDITQLSSAITSLNDRISELTTSAARAASGGTNGAETPQNEKDLSLRSRAWLLETMGSLVNVWLLENSHEPAGESVREWSQVTAVKCLRGVEGFLGRYNTLDSVRQSFEDAVTRVKVNEVHWMTCPSKDPDFIAVRRNYHLWSPPPTDVEWCCEKVLLQELRLRVTAAIDQSSWNHDQWSLERTIEMTKQAATLTLPADGVVEVDRLAAMARIPAVRQAM